MIDQEQYVMIGVAKDLFAAPVARVHEILEMRPISPLPRSPSNVLGIMDVRGESILVYDLRMTLGMPPQPDSLSTRVVVVAINGEKDPVTVGLRADRVSDVVLLDDEVVDSAPSFGGGEKNDCIAGIGRHKGDFAIILNLDRLLGDTLPSGTS